MKILGISCFYHDSSIAIIDDDQIVFSISEERVSRKKHDNSFPLNAIKKAFDFLKIEIKDIDKITYYEKPDLKFKRILDQVYKNWPDSKNIFEKHLQNYYHEKYDIENIIRKKLNFNGEMKTVEHHLSHASSAFYTSNFDNSLIIIADGVGEFETTSIFLGEGNKITKLESLNFPDSLGLFYSVFTDYLGFEVNEGEYKVMGLAPYGNPIYLDKLIPEVIDIKTNGFFSLNKKYFNFNSEDHHYSEELIEYLGIKPYVKGEKMSQELIDLSSSVQKALEIALKNLFKYSIDRYGIKNICFSGGVALNCTANSMLVRDLGICLHIHPAAGDSGSSLGCALYESVNSIENRDRIIRFDFQPYLGLSFNDEQIESFLKSKKINFSKSENSSEFIAKKLSDGYVIGLLQGRDEWGPRALGNRSILADPRTFEMKDHLNSKIKFREEFRPFAPVIIKDYYEEYYETLDMKESPFMLFTHKSKKPENTQATSHVDHTSRVQTVTSTQNEKLFSILENFKKITGVPVLTNTSFNLKGEPIVSSPEDAIKTFENSGIDFLIIEDFIIDKNYYNKNLNMNIHKIKESDYPIKYVNMQRLYMDTNGFLKPNTELWDENDSLRIRVNSLGCKNNEINDHEPIIAFFGDSTTMGLNVKNDSWVNHVKLKGFQNLNAAVEGWNMDMCLSKCRELTSKINLDKIVVYVGWHNIIYNNTSENYWESVLLEFASKTKELYVCTMATSLIDDFETVNISDYLTGISSDTIDSKDKDYEDDYWFWGNMTPSNENCKLIIRNIKRYNEFVKNFCTKHNFHIIDLHEFMKPKSLKEIKIDYFDLCHFRESSYPKIGKFILDYLNNDSIDNQLSDIQKAEFKNQVNSSTYPLW